MISPIDALYIGVASAAAVLGGVIGYRAGHRLADLAGGAADDATQALNDKTDEIRSRLQSKKSAAEEAVEAS